MALSTLFHLIFSLSARRETAWCEARECRNSEISFKLAQQRIWPFLAALRAKK